MQNDANFNLQSRRYIGNKYKLTEWIFDILHKECKGDSFADIFAGTGVVSAEASKYYKKIIINDFLYSNNIIYKGFFNNKKDIIDYKKISKIITKYNSLNPKEIKDNYFSNYYGEKYFSKDSAKLIGFIRDDIEKRKDRLTEKEYNTLLSSLIYSVDKIANTVGHYDAYIKKAITSKLFNIKMINPIISNNLEIYKSDANDLVRKIKADIVYIDPPYNSRQYSRFYHLLENLSKWDKPKLFGVALKPEPENISSYSKSDAISSFHDLIKNINAKYIVVSYNNTYKPKSHSSKNKISHEQILSILKERGNTKVFEKKYRHFNSGKTSFNDHKEYLFLTYVNN